VSSETIIPGPAPWTAVRVAPDRATAEGWAFVLDALGIANQVQEIETGGFALWVAGADTARAVAALAAQDRELREESAAAVPRVPDLGPSAAGVVFALAIAVFHLVTGGRGGGDLGGWFQAGAAVAERIVGGEWWRALTALTLHADAAHVLGNAVAALIFMAALGRWIGTGLALLLTVAAGGLGNLLVAFAYGHGHSSVGASTATFGALGLLGGLQCLRWFRGRRAVGGRRRAFTVVAACLGLFALLGVGERSDVLAHLAGLAVGLVMGVLVGRALVRPLPRSAQLACSLGTVVAVTAAWALALP
jgi:rhomboid protease GluP